MVHSFWGMVKAQFEGGGGEAQHVLACLGELFHVIRLI